MRDRHLAAAEPLAGARPPVAGIQLSCSSRAISTMSGTLLGRISFFTPMTDASKSFFFFPFVMWQRAMVRVGAKVSVVWVMAGMMPVAF
jgi:hypothetical protein